MSIRVLLADDQAMIRSGLRRILEDQDDITVVGEAADGAEAVELARRLRPDACLVDIRMPRLDGIDVTRALADPGLADPLRVAMARITSVSRAESAWESRLMDSFEPRA
ncbi:response regulator transcription factor [Streptomyces sp. ISL-86]|nr:response regulator transcription factor [Streptomyces sp. ISL-86]